MPVDGGWDPKVLLGKKETFLLMQCPLCSDLHMQPPQRHWKSLEPVLGGCRRGEGEITHTHTHTHAQKNLLLMQWDHLWFKWSSVNWDALTWRVWSGRDEEPPPRHHHKRHIHACIQPRSTQRNRIRGLFLKKSNTELNWHGTQIWFSVS